MKSGANKMSETPFRLSVHALIRNSNGKYLLLRRSGGSRVNPGKWDFPGGKIEIGENIDEALEREVKEETGIGFRVTGVGGAIGTQTLVEGLHIVFLIMEGEHTSGNVVMSNEHDDFRWVSFHEMSGMDLCPQFLDFLKDYEA